MGRIAERIKVFRRWTHRYISPVFIALFCASFILWYILKLGNVYTTDYSVLVNIEGETLRVPCVVEGVGTNLFGYRVYMHKELKIPLTDLKYKIVHTYDEETGEPLGREYVFDQQSMQSAISVRFSDIKVISVGDIPTLPVPEKAATESVSPDKKSSGKRSSDKKSQK